MTSTREALSHLFVCLGCLMHPHLLCQALEANFSLACWIFARNDLSPERFEWFSLLPDLCHALWASSSSTQLEQPKLIDVVHAYVVKPRTFLGIFRLFWYFWGLFCRPPKRPFWDFFAISGPEGPETPVNGGSDRKAGDNMR